MNAIENCKPNIMGTVSFDGKFPGMRKAQDFIVYPMKTGERRVTIQSDTRIGVVYLDSGELCLSRSLPSGARFHNVPSRDGLSTCRLDAESMFSLKAAILSTASGRAGSNGVVYVDNSGALDAFPSETTA